MPDLLFEVFSEEIPARMQAQAAEDLKKLVTQALVDRGLTYEGAASFATPRRLALHIAGLPAKQPDVREEKKGPRVGAPEAAVQGFLKSAGLASLDQATVEKDPKKGEFYVAVIERPGRATLDVLAEVLPAVLRAFPWPKSMRWGAASAKPEALRWVRPLHSIVATFGPETEEPEIVRFSLDGIESGDVTCGHRFMAPGPIKVRRFDDYVPALEKAKVVLDPARRREIILADARDLAFAQGLELVEDEGLLNEVAGLVEWPVVLMGEFDEAFLDIPPEVIRATIRANQKCFVLKKRDAADGALANKFILVSNIEATDGGKAIAAGNGRVVRARLSDALYFWETDRKPLPDAALYKDAAEKLGLDLSKTLDQRMAKLAHLNVVFHEKLGTQGARVERIVALAREIAPLVGGDIEKAARAARLAKADLSTEVVGEFPETQGLMGRRYALLQGEDESVAAAIEEHYKPQGPSDRVPSNPVSLAVALADKLDTLAGFWAIDEKPTGSKDPYALRRAALGVIRICVENDARVALRIYIKKAVYKLLAHGGGAFCEKIYNESPDWLANELVRYARSHYAKYRFLVQQELEVSWLKAFGESVAYEKTMAGMVSFATFFESDAFVEKAKEIYEAKADVAISKCREINQRLFEIHALWAFDHEKKSVPQTLFQSQRFANAISSDLLAFFADRLKVYLRDKGARHDLIDAVFALEGQDDLLMIVKRVEALGAFLDTEDGKNLLAGYKRAANILKAEEKKEKDADFGAPYERRDDAPEAEKILAAAISSAVAIAVERVALEDFEGAMKALAGLRAPVDRFFEDVTVNDPDPAKRLNRLRLLNALRGAVHKVADFSKIGG